MKTEYLYAFLDADGRCRRVDGGGTTPVDLAALLADGWRPLRETVSPAPTGTSALLLVLEREVEGSIGFGFNPK